MASISINGKMYEMSQTVFELLDSTITEVEELRSYTKELSEALLNMMLLIEEHGSTTMKAHTSRLIPAWRTLQKGKENG